MSQISSGPESLEIAPDRPVLLFSGQGSQMAGMGRDLAEKSASAMQLWQDAEKASGLPLREIYWEGDEDAMSNTAALQPALTATNLNLWQAYAERSGVQPAACAGHSLGEFSALAAAGIISPKDAVAITALRGKLMAEADPEGTGAMAAIVKLPEADVREIVSEAGAESGELIVAANFNTPLQTVVSGAKRAVNLACEKAKMRKGRSMLLKVSGAFHSPLMAGANEKLAPLLDSIAWRDPAFPLFCNAGDMPVKTGSAAKKNILRQMVSPVYWVNLMRNLYLAGARWYMEISPRAVLGKMVGPSMAGLAGQCDELRVELLSSLAGIL